MKKPYMLKVFGLPTALAFVLVFVGFHILHAQVQIQGKGGKSKPPKNRYTWKAVILPGGDLHGVGDDRLSPEEGGWVYEDIEESVVVYNTIGTSRKSYRTMFHFDVYNLAKIEFQEIYLYSYYEDAT